MPRAGHALRRERRFMQVVLARLSPVALHKSAGETESLQIAETPNVLGVRPHECLHASSRSICWQMFLSLSLRLACACFSTKLLKSF